MEEKIAYIYIMTNPTFSGHNWVKIGYAKDPEKRRRQLSTTNIPYPYEIYATYEIPESEHLGDKVLHKIITNLNPNLRLTQNREFFEMTPEQAYELLRAIAIIHNREDKLVAPKGAPIERKQKNLPKKEEKKAPDVDAGLDELIIKIDGEEAVMTMNIDSCIVKAGSPVRLKIDDRNPCKKMQEEDLSTGLLIEGDNGVAHLKEDKVFKASSTASKYVCGYSCNGNITWKTRGGILLKDYLAAKNESN